MSADLFLTDRAFIKQNDNGRLKFLTKGKRFTTMGLDEFKLTYMCCPRLCSHGGWLLLKCSAIGGTHFRHPTDEQLGHVDILFSNYYNLQSVYFELLHITIQVKIHSTFILLFTSFQRSHFNETVFGVIILAQYFW